MVLMYNNKSFRARFRRYYIGNKVYYNDKITNDFVVESVFVLEIQSINFYNSEKIVKFYPTCANNSERRALNFHFLSL